MTLTRPLYRVLLPSSLSAAMVRRRPLSEMLASKNMPAWRAMILDFIVRRRQTLQTNPLLSLDSTVKSSRHHRTGWGQIILHTRLVFKVTSFAALFDHTVSNALSSEPSVADNISLISRATTINLTRSGADLSSRNLSTRKRAHQSSESIPALPRDLASKRPRRVTRESWKAREARELSEA